MVGFKSDIVQWVAKVSNRLEALPPTCGKILIDNVRTPVKQGGNMPVVSGNLRNSIDLNFSGPRPADRVLDQNKPIADPVMKLYDRLERMRLGSHVYIFFRAIYGPKMEMKYAFVRLAAQKWPQVVAAGVARVKKQFP